MSRSRRMHFSLLAGSLMSATAYLSIVVFTCIRSQSILGGVEVVAHIFGLAIIIGVGCVATWAFSCVVRKLSKRILCFRETRPEGSLDSFWAHGQDQYIEELQREQKRLIWDLRKKEKRAQRESERCAIRHQIRAAKHRYRRLIRATNRHLH